MSTPTPGVATNGVALIGVALIGGGFMADVHSRAARAAGARLVGVTSSSPGRSRVAAERIGADRAFDDVDALLADPHVDVVHIVTPNATHHELTVRALAAGKHVVCKTGWSRLPMTTGACRPTRGARRGL